MLKKITLSFLILTCIGSVFALSILGFKIPWTQPLTPVLTIFSFIFSVLHAGQREGWIKTVFFCLIVFTTGLLFESLGVATGLVYGPYHYTDQLGAKFLNLVPYLIPVAWIYMIYPSMLIAKIVIPAQWKGLKAGLGVSMISGVVMTAWDVVMDPMMVYGGNWVWEVEGAYFGVPLQNFFGWWLTTFAAVGLYLLATRKLKEKTSTIPDRWAVFMYIQTGITSFVTCLLVDLNGPALAGLFAMLPWMLTGWWSTLKLREKREYAADHAQDI